MKSKFKIIPIIFIILLSVVMFSACDKLFPLADNSGGNNTNNLSSIKFVFHDIPDSFEVAASDFYNNKTGYLRIPTEEPTKEGYTFDGWYMDEEYTKSFAVGTKPTESEIHIYAKWKTAVYDVVIYDGTGANQRYSFVYNTIPALSEPTKEGYEFDGWYLDDKFENEYIPSKLKSDLNLYVNWTYKEYTITYETFGGIFADEVKDEYNIGEKVTLAEPDKKDYIFVGWYDNPKFNGEAITEFSSSVGNKTFYAKYLCNKAEMAVKKGISAGTGTNREFYSDYNSKVIDVEMFFDFSEGSTYVLLSGTSTVNAINLEENNEPGLKEYNFTVRVIAESGNASQDYNLTIYQYNSDTVTVSYYVDDEFVHSEALNKGGIVAEYVWTGSKEGYLFENWLNGSSVYVYGSPITDNIRLDAKFKPVVYSITYYVGSGKNPSGNRSEYTIEDNFIFEDAVCAEGYGYSFSGWYTEKSMDNECLITAVNGTVGNLTLYAKYTKSALFDFSKDEEGIYNIDISELEALLNYAVFYGLTSVDAKIANVETQAEFIDAKENVKITVPYLDFQESTSYSVSGGYADVKITYTYGIAPTKTVNSGYYEQVDFEDWIITSGRTDFNDYAINHVGTKLDVSSGNQLYYALENGYVPNCAADSVAEQVYLKALEILDSIIENNMSEKDKALAIAEYLVRTVAYDNYVNGLYQAGYGDTAKEYRSFSPESAIIDKIAVCDGISKAYVILCAIEGIKAIRVNGTHGGVNHAWNKVYVDLDGDGNKEWSVVDCTSANTLLSSGKEIMNHAYIFVTDEIILSEDADYSYDAIWKDGLTYKYLANKDYNIYKDYQVENGENDIGLYAETKDDLVEIFKYIKKIYNEASAGTELCFDFSAPTELLDSSSWSSSGWLSDTMKAAEMYGISINHSDSFGQADGDKVIVIITEKQ